MDNITSNQDLALEFIREDGIRNNNLQAVVRAFARWLDGRHTVETPAKQWPDYTNAIGDAGSQYMQRCNGRTSSGLFYWYELWDVLNRAARPASKNAERSIGCPECGGGVRYEHEAECSALKAGTSSETERSDPSPTVNSVEFERGWRAGHAAASSPKTKGDSNG